MMITYTNSIEDAIEWQMNHFENSPEIQKKMRYGRIISPIIIFISLLGMGILEQKYGLIITGTIVSSFFYFYTPHSNKKHLRKLAEKTFQEGVNKGFLCQHSLEATKEILIEKTDAGSQTSKWESVEKIVDTEKYIFIYTGSVMAHIIPKNKIIEGNLDEFLELITTYYNSENCSK